MVIFEVHIKYIKVKYKSTFLSKATFLVTICGMLSIILPFIFAYKSGGFWLKHDTFYEQPKINLRGEYLLLATTSNITYSIICSNIPYYRQHLGMFDFCSTIKLREIDNNLDGKIDKLNLNIDINLARNEITSLNLILPINYQLKTVCPIQMQSAIIYQYYFPQTLATDLQVMGDLNIIQSSAIKCRRRGYNFYDYSIIEDQESGYQLENIIERYSERNISTHLSNVYTNIVSGRKNKFKFKLVVRYPEHMIHYKPNFWHIMKWAWIQYFAVYVIISWILRTIKNYIFNNKLVLFYEDKPFKKA